MRIILITIKLLQIFESKGIKLISIYKNIFLKNLLIFF
jgi:hypothetical protein